MKHLGDLLAGLRLPSVESPAEAPTSLAGCDAAADELVHVLGAGLPAGHLHVWGGPTGAGKTSFLLCLLHSAAVHGRRVAYATYDLSATTLATRMLAMGSGVGADRLSGGGVDGADGARAARVRAALARLPFWFLEARGLGVASIRDRLVRMPQRADVLAVDYLQAVVREPESDMGQALRDLSEVASRLHVAVVCALRSDPQAADLMDGCGSIEAALRSAGDRADRVGWIAPSAGSGARRAEVLRNRYGDRPAVPLRFDPATGRLRRDDRAS